VTHPRSEHALDRLEQLRVQLAMLQSYLSARGHMPNYLAVTLRCVELVDEVDQHVRVLDACIADLTADTSPPPAS
jgi:hypothetical protein